MDSRGVWLCETVSQDFSLGEHSELIKLFKVSLLGRGFFSLVSMWTEKVSCLLVENLDRDPP